MTVRAMQTAEIAKLFILAVSCWRLSLATGCRLPYTQYYVAVRGCQIVFRELFAVAGNRSRPVAVRGSRSLCGRCAVRGRCAVHLSRFAIRDAYAYARRSRSRFAVATGCGCCNRTPKPYSLPIITIVLITHIATNATIATAVRIVLVTGILRDLRERPIVGHIPPLDH